MPTTYTPNASNNPATITLPSDLDDAIAESVNVALRAVADRGAHVYQLAALLAQSNIFTANEQQISNNSADTACILVIKDAANDPTSGNKWKHILQVKVANTSASVHVYAGDSSATGQFIIVYNAGWDTAAQHWHADDTGKVTLAIMLEAGTGLRFARRLAGGGTWTDWSTLITSTIDTDINAPGDVNANRVFSLGAIKAGTTFDYASPRIDVKLGDLSRVQPYGSATLTRSLSGVTLVGANDAAVLKLELDSGSILTGVDVMFTLSTGTTFQIIELHRYSGTNWSSPAAPSGSGAIASGTTPVASGTQVASFSGLTETFDNATKRYMLLLGKTGATHAGDIIEEIRIHYTNPGPHNF